jgi:hypothetical protein
MVEGKTEPEFEYGSRICDGAFSVVSRAADNDSELSSSFSAAPASAPPFVTVQVLGVGFLPRRPNTRR